MSLEAGTCRSKNLLQAIEDVARKIAFNCVQLAMDKRWMNMLHDTIVVPASSGTPCQCDALWPQTVPVHFALGLPNGSRLAVRGRGWCGGASADGSADTLPAHETLPNLEEVSRRPSLGE